MVESQTALDGEVVHSGVAEIARSVPHTVDRSVDIASRARFIATVTADKPRAERKPWRALAIAASIVAALSVGELARRSRQGTPAPSLLVAGRAMTTTLEAVQIAALDGSRITVAPRSVARVLTSDARGADLELSRGTLSLAVHHRADTRWSVIAGAVRIHVTGTRFQATRSPTDERVDVQLFEGSLRVVVGEQRTIEMHSGQRLRVVGTQGEHIELDTPSVTNSSTVTDASSASQPAIESSSSIVDASTIRLASGDAMVAAPVPAQRPVPSAPEPQAWHLLVMQGEFAAVVREARAQRDSLGQRSIDELVALAEAGRHEGDLAWTETAYEAIFDRHLARAHDRGEATFACGRTAETAGDLGRAIEWYRRYEEGFSEGPHGSDAIGRQFVLEQRRGRIARAQELARRYLIREGGGPFAARAHSLLSD